MIGESMFSVQRVIPMSPCGPSFQVDLVLWWVAAAAADDSILFTERDQEDSRGVTISDREGSVRERGVIF